MTILNDTTVVIFTSTDWKLYEIINHNLSSDNEELEDSLVFVDNDNNINVF